MIAILYNIRSAHNVGSIFRTADAAGIKEIYLCGITPAPIDKYGRIQKEIAKTALGAEKYVKSEKIDVKKTGKLLEELKRGGHEILAIEQSNKSIPYYKYKSATARGSGNNVVLIIGNEVRGLPKSILQKADKILEIPMHGRKESLNVAVAFGVVAFELRHHK